MAFDSDSRLAVAVINNEMLHLWFLCEDRESDRDYGEK